MAARAWTACVWRMRQFVRILFTRFQHSRCRFRQVPISAEVSCCVYLLFCSPCRSPPPGHSRKHKTLPRKIVTRSRSWFPRTSLLPLYPSSSPLPPAMPEAPGGRQDRMNRPFTMLRRLKTPSRRPRNPRLQYPRHNRDVRHRMAANHQEGVRLLRPPNRARRQARRATKQPQPTAAPQKDRPRRQRQKTNRPAKRAPENNRMADCSGVNGMRH